MTPFDPWFPVLMYRIARKDLKEDTNPIEEKVQQYQDMTYPVCPVSFSWAENPEVLK